MPTSAPAVTVTKKELALRLTEKVEGLTAQKAVAVMQGVLDVVLEAVIAGERLELRDFGVFETAHRAARTAHNPKTFAKVDVPASKRVKFKPGRLMREACKPAKA